jgi:hypothetical protein
MATVAGAANAVSTIPSKNVAIVEAEVGAEVRKGVDSCS